MALCHYCEWSEGSTQDHVIPKARGGPDDAWNLVPACFACNQYKADRMPTCLCSFCLNAHAKWQEWELFKRHLERKRAKDRQKRKKITGKGLSPAAQRWDRIMAERKAPKIRPNIVVEEWEDSF